MQLNDLGSPLKVAECVVCGESAHSGRFVSVGWGVRISVVGWSARSALAKPAVARYAPTLIGSHSGDDL